MNILFLEQHPRFGGGSERMSFALCGHALAKGHRAWLAYQLAGDMVDAYRAAGATCVQLPIAPIAVRKPGATARAVGALRRLVKRAGIDVVFTSQVGYASLLAIVGRMTGVQTAVHLGLVYDFPSPIFRTAIRHLTLGVAPSMHTAEGWKERGWPAASLIVIPNGVDTARFTPGDGRMAARQRLGLSGARGPLIAYVGRLTRVKGILTLARAFAGYRRAGGEGTLIYVGASLGDDEAVLRSLAQAEGLTDSMWAVRPAIAKPEDVYRAADLVVAPSEWDEPFGLVPLEAMATGTLAVVSDRGVMPTFVECLGGDAVFRAGDAVGLQGRLQYWLADVARRESAAARVADHVRSTFSFAACGDAYLSALSTGSSAPVLAEARQQT